MDYCYKGEHWMNEESDREVEFLEATGSCPAHQELDNLYPLGYTPTLFEFED